MKDKVQGARWAPVFLLCRALSEAKSKTKAELSAAGSAEQLENESQAQTELSASQFGTLNECELKAKQEFSERNKQSLVKPSRRRRLNLVQKLYWRFLGIESGYRKRKWNKISRELDRCGYRAEKLIIIPV